MATYRRGVVTTIGGSAGLLQNVQFTEATDTEEAQDENGEVAAFEDFNEQADATMEVVWDTTQTLPDVGSTVVVAGALKTAWNGNWALRRLIHTENNRAYVRTTYEAHRYLANSLPAAS